MSRISNTVAARAREILTASASLDRQIGLLAEEAGIQITGDCSRRILSLNAASDLVEKAGATHYPAVYMYCERLENKLREKFRVFSGTAYLVAEVRVSQERLDGLERVVQVHVDALLSVLDANRGDWGQGMFFAGGYEVVYGPVRQGGRNFIQAVKVTFAVEISTD